MIIYSDSRERLMDVTEQITGEEIYSITKVKASGNSQSFAVKTHKNKYFVKKYYRHPKDSRDRLMTEFTGMKYLWQEGIRCIPKAIGRDYINNIAVYEFIEGEKVKNGEITAADIDRVCKFIAGLKEISERPESKQLNVASEASFSVTDIFKNLDYSFRNLMNVGRSTKNKELLDLLYYYKEIFEKVKKQCIKECQSRRISFENKLPEKYRVLSSSDFGFHNSFRVKNRIIFHDFEYFGWDDPVKLISDFLIHPKMKLGKEIKKEFFRKMLIIFSDDKEIENRFRIMFPLFQLKWVLIMLNAFLPQVYKRREFAAGKKLNRLNVQKRQLKRAGRLLGSIKL